MRLVTPKQASEELFVSTGLIQYWIKKGLLEKYPYELAPSTVRVRKRTLSHSRYKVDIDEAKKLRRADREDQVKLLNSDKRLLRPAEVSKILEITENNVYQMVARYNLTKYPVGVSTLYLIDGDELADALEDDGMGYLVK
jgi:hypothetical protein